MTRIEQREKVSKRRQVNNVNESTQKETDVKEKELQVEPKYGPMPTFPNQRIFARGVMILATFAIIYFTSKTDKETILAKQREQIQGRGHNVACSDDYVKDLTKFPGCVPEKCGRYVSDKLVTEIEAERLLEIGKKGLALASPDGGAAILDLHSGALSRGKHFVNLYSLNDSDKIFSVKDLAIYRVVRTKIQHAAAHHFGVSAESLYLTYPTFFSQLTDKPAVTAHDEYWHPHVDKDQYKSFHYTSLLYLNNHGVDFQGGRFVFREPDNSTVVVEPRKGRVSMFTSGRENVHYIEKITSGVRYALTVSFSCDKQYAINDPTIPSTSR